MQNIGLKTTKVEKLTDDTIFIQPTLTTHAWPLEICYDFNAYFHGNNLKIIIKNCQKESWSELCIYSTRLSMVCYASKYSLPLTIISNGARSSSACEIDWNFSKPHAWPLHNEAVIATKGGPTHLKMIKFITKIVFYFHFLSTHCSVLVTSLGFWGKKQLVKICSNNFKWTFFIQNSNFLYFHLAFYCF